MNLDEIEARYPDNDPIDIDVRALVAEVRKLRAEVDRLYDSEQSLSGKLTKADLQIDELKAALYAECRGLACESEGCYVGYRSCSGCEARAKKAYGPDWGKEVKRVEHSDFTKIEPGAKFGPPLEGGAAHVSHCYGTACCYLTMRTCICLCAKCADAKARDH